MSLFSGDALWPNINASHFGPVAMCIWDTGRAGFRPLTASDSLFTFSSGVTTIVQSGGSLNIVNTGTITGNVNAYITNPFNSFNTVSNYAVSGSGQNGTALASNAARKALFVQNLGMNPLYIKFGTAGASDSSLSMVLAGGTISGDGKGGSFLDAGCQVTGLIAVSGVQPNYIIWDA